MTTSMVPGQNRPASGARVVIDISALPRGGRFSMAVVPTGRPGTKADQPFLAALHGIHPFVALGPDGRGEVSLDAVAPTTERLLVVVYAVRSASMLSDLGSAAILVDGTPMAPREGAATACACVVAEFYRRGDAWKLRALDDAVLRGLPELGRRLGLDLDDGGPEQSGVRGGGRAGTPPGPSPRPPAGGQGRGRPDHTGSGFLVAPGLLMTNAHVVADTRRISVASFEGRCDGEAVLVDERNDLALVRMERSFDLRPLTFRRGRGPGLGETVVTVGYPLAGLLGSGPQVAQGSVSGLLGPGDDVRALQISSPIQPGSSGGPVIDLKGRVVGVVTASLTSGQNVNFAVRGCLAQALVEAAGKQVALDEGGPTLDVSDIADAVRGAVWLLECSR